MIGSVRYPLGDIMVEAVLMDNGRWQAPGEEIQDLLNALYRLGTYGPARGQPGRAELFAAAELLNGFVDIIRDPDAPTSTEMVY